jgi:acyl-CoA dehydrogenase
MQRLIEPSYLAGVPSPYFTESHTSFQQRLREYLETEVVPHIDKWTESKSYPYHMHKRFYELGVQQAIFRVSPELGGPVRGRYDSFHELIVWMELGRISLNSVTFMVRPSSN